MFDRPDLVHASVRGGFAGAQMLVIGDLMLDRYLVGDVARISPEAPVPIARITRTEDLQPGDLLFFHDDLGHMGMYIGNGQMIHAPQTGDVLAIASWP